jgi:probable HAF family extracellular repeat protein
MHIGKVCLRSFFYAAPLKQEYNPARKSLASPKSTSITGCNTPSGESIHTSRAVQFELHFMEVIMKRISILTCILGVCFVSAAWAQQPATKPPFGRHVPHRMANQTSRTPGLTVSRSFRAQANPDCKAKIWELGTYLGGTWAATQHLNDLGVIVGRGDVPPIGPDGVGYTHTLVVNLFGPHAGEWIDLGALRTKQPTGWEEPVADISNTGLVVSHSTAKGGHAHGVAWTEETGMVDLGTLADTGNPQYASYKTSYAIGTNKLGTLIVGGSAPHGNTDVGFLAPVVWTPSNGWQIHKLDSSAFPNFGWDIWGVNDYGQIIGVGGNSHPQTTVVGVLWNPRADGKGWNKLMSLPLSPDYPFTDPYGINEMGEIVGVVASADWSTTLPVLWEPLDNKRTKYSQPIVFPLPEGGFASCEAVGINDLGDIVGDCWNEDGSVDLPTRWTTKDATFSEIINFPGDWGFSWGVNNNRIASVTYGGGTNCPADTYGSCGGAIQLH